MKRRFLVMLLCAGLICLLPACAGKGAEETKNNTEDQGGDTDSKEPLLGADATDEELLEALKDDINVIAEEDYIKTVEDIKENVNNYTGSLYQIEGYYTEEDSEPYIARTVAAGEKETVSGLPLKYLSQDLQEGDWIRVTGVVNVGEVGGRNVPVLEVTVLELPVEPGQSTLKADD